MSERYSPLLELTKTRIKEFGRETEAIFWVFGFPLILTLALGFAFRERPPDRIPIGVVAGPDAQRQLAALAKSPALQPRIYEAAAGREELRRGKISLLVESGHPPSLSIRSDAPRRAVGTRRGRPRAAGRRRASRRFTANEIRATEQGSRYIDFLVPGLLGMNLMGTGMWGMGFTTANARMKKLLKRLVATPMRKSHYLISQFLSRLVFLVFEVVVVALFAWLVFDVVINGSIALFALICLIGGMTFAALGLLVASRARTLEAVSGLMNLVMVPMWLLSGVFFSYERFPDSVKPFIRALPLTALNDALRDVMNDGYGIAQVAPELAIMLVWTVVTYTVGLKIFRWQ